MYYNVSYIYIYIWIKFLVQRNVHYSRYNNIGLFQANPTWTTVWPAYPDDNWPQPASIMRSIDRHTPCLSWIVWPIQRAKINVAIASWGNTGPLLNDCLFIACNVFYFTSLSNRQICLTHESIKIHFTSRPSTKRWSGLGLPGAWNLTDQDAVDELVHLFELDERLLKFGFLLSVTTTWEVKHG